MLTLLLRMSLLLTLLAALPIFIIRARPYEDSELFALLTPPEGCAMPCFMGVRPGVTSVEEAMQILQSHPWVAEGIESREFSRIVVVWDSAEPSLIDTGTSGRFSFAGGVIQNINIRTRIRLGDLWAGSGQVDWAIQIPASINRPPGRAFRLGYHQMQPLFSFFVPTDNGRVSFDDLITVPLNVYFGPLDADYVIAEPSLRYLWRGSQG